MRAKQLRQRNRKAAQTKQGILKTGLAGNKTQMDKVHMTMHPLFKFHTEM